MIDISNLKFGVVTQHFLGCWMMFGFWLRFFSCVGIGFSWKAWTAALGKASLSPMNDGRLGIYRYFSSWLLPVFAPEMMAVDCFSFLSSPNSSMSSAVALAGFSVLSDSDLRPALFTWRTPPTCGGGFGEEPSCYWLTFRAGAWPPFMSISATSAIVTDFIVQVLKWTLTTRLISSKLSSKVWRTSSGRVGALRENWITTAKFIVRGEAAAAHLSDGPGVHTAAARARLLTATATTGASHLVAGRINSLLTELHHFYHHWCLCER